jgi:tripartite-type tricarboxylate transporter receptor subunit TctC
VSIFKNSTIGEVKRWGKGGPAQEGTVMSATIDEAGLPGFELGSWYGLFAPAGTATDIVRQLYRETAKAVTTADVRNQFAAMGADAVGSTAEELAAVVQRDLAKWAKVARDVNLEKQ